jgi:ATP-binding cassette, subfamily B, bacterial
MSMSTFRALRSLRQDPDVTRKQLTPGTLRRIASYARPYRRDLILFLTVVTADALLIVAVPLLLVVLIDDGIEKRDIRLVVYIAVAVAGIGLLDALLNILRGWYSARIGQGLIYDLRTEAFRHVQRQPIAFFMRTETGALISRLNSDVLEAQQALTSTLATVLSNFVSLILIIATMFYLSWIVAVITIGILPMFLLPARLLGHRIQRLTREAMQLDAQMTSSMVERFNVAGAMLVKLFGRPAREVKVFARRAARVRDVGVMTTLYGRAFFILMNLLASMAIALVYGLGGTLVINRSFQLGTLVALASLLGRTYGPITGLSNVQVDVMTSLVSFDRVFEVLDLEPLVVDRPGSVPLQVARVNDPTDPELPPSDIEFENIVFQYPTASEVSLASLESIVAPSASEEIKVDVLDGVSFYAPAGRLTALVGHSGAGKTTITHLACRLYEPDQGVIRIGGQDLAMVTQQSLRDVIGVVTQEAHLFHDTIRVNLEFASPGASEAVLIEACKLAQMWDHIAALPDGLDTIVGDRGYRLSGGEKQRVALARLLIKAPPVVILDEATAHLDSESEAAVQEALRTALTGRTSLVIAHRLSTIQEADQILLIEAGRVAERGSHDELLDLDGLYARLYRTQFALHESATLF